MANLFSSSDQKKRLSHVKNLILIAAADGKIDKSEIKLISTIATRVGLSVEELNSILKNPQKISFSPPSKFDEKIIQLYDMVFLMMIDGEIHKNEVALCQYYATKLGFEREIIEKIVLAIINAIKEGQNLDQVTSTLKKEYA